MRIARFVLPTAAVCLAPAVAAGPLEGHAPAGTGQRFELTLDREGEVVLAGVVLDGVRTTLALTPHSNRDEGFRVLTDAGGGELVAHPAPAPRTYRGIAAGIGEASVAASLVDGALRAVVLLREGGVERMLAIEPAEDGLHRWYDAADLPAHRHRCIIDDALVIGGGAGGGIAPGPAEEDCLLTALVAFDADFEYYQLNGSSVEATIADVEAFMNVVNMIYERDVRITHLLGDFIVRTSADQPYNTNDAVGRLFQFREEWNTNQAHIPRDAAHFFTGAELGGAIGVAWVGVICNLDFPDYHYGLSQARFSPDFALGVQVVAHELGHNWNALHCDGDPDCAIMCPWVGGCTGHSDYFGQRSRQAIRSWAENATCLGELCPDCPADLNGDGQVDAADFFMYLDWFAAGDARADLNGDGELDGTDFFMYLDLFAQGCD